MRKNFEIEDPSKRYIKNFTEDRKAFEDSLIACLDSDEQLYDQAVRSNLCNVNQVDNSYTILEFEDGQLNALFLATCMARKLLGRGTNRIDYQVIQNFLKHLTTQPGSCGITQSQVGETVMRLMQLHNQTPIKDLSPMVREGFARWLAKKRMTSKVQQATSEDDWDPESVIEAANSAMHGISRSQKKNKNRMADCFVDSTKVAPRLRMGEPRLDDCLGGGFAKGQATLAIAAPGSGKTVFANQVASGMAMFNGEDVRGLLVSTEEEHDELFPRLVSSRLSIDFNKIKDGVDPNNLSPEERGKVMDLVRDIGDKLVYENWQKLDSGTSFEQDMEACILNHIREFGRLDFLVFDWLGAGISSKIGDDLGLARLLYQQAADALCNLAKKYQIAVVFFAQANKSQSEGKQRVRAIHCGECKSLDNNAYVVIGISGLKKKSEDTEDQEDAFEPRQYLFFDKNRKARAKLLHVDREFHYQRFHFPKSKARPPAFKR